MNQSIATFLRFSLYISLSQYIYIYIYIYFHPFLPASVFLSVWVYPSIYHEITRRCKYNWLQNRIPIITTQHQINANNSFDELNFNWKNKQKELIFLLPKPTREMAKTNSKHHRLTTTTTTTTTTTKTTTKRRSKIKRTAKRKEWTNFSFNESNNDNYYSQQFDTLILIQRSSNDK